MGLIAYGFTQLYHFVTITLKHSWLNTMRNLSNSFRLENSILSGHPLGYLMQFYLSPNQGLYPLGHFVTLTIPYPSTFPSHSPLPSPNLSAYPFGHFVTSRSPTPLHSPPTSPSPHPIFQLTPLGTLCPPNSVSKSCTLAAYGANAEQRSVSSSTWRKYLQNGESRGKGQAFLKETRAIWTYGQQKSIINLYWRG